jgi:DNA-binding NarL/FixJ family response regulator
MVMTTSSDGAPPVEILLVEDNVGDVRLTQEALKEGKVYNNLHWAKDGVEALEFLRREGIHAKAPRPDIILLDLNFGGESGMELLPKLSKVAPEARVIIMTGVRDLEVHQQAISYGAMGLVLKHDALEHIARAIKQVSGGDVWFNRSMMMKVIEGMVRSTAVKQADPEAAKIATLTEREREVISLVGEGLKNKEIASRLRPFISETTVRHHLTSIYDKLGVSDRLELVIYAYIHGLATLPTSLPNLNNRLK